MDLVLSEIGMVPIVLQVSAPDQVSPFHQLVVLGAGEGMLVEGLGDLQTCCPPHVGGPKDGKLYSPIRNPQYNNSNYQASVSLPGWSTSS